MAMVEFGEWFDNVGDRVTGLENENSGLSRVELRLF